MIRLSCLVLLALLTIGCQTGPTLKTGKLVGKSGSSSPVLNLEVAADDRTRQLGLMYRKELAPDAGMLFIFPDDQIRSFWMKNTFIELDIIFLTENLRSVSYIERAKPLSERRLESSGPARYVLEVPGGSLERWGIRDLEHLELKP